MDVGGTEPIAKRLAVFSTPEEVVKVAANFIVELLFGIFGIVGLADKLREAVEVYASLGVGRRLTAMRRVPGSSGRPDFVGESDVIALVAQQQGISRDRRIPNGAAEDSALPGPPEVLSGKQRAAARGAGGRIHKSVREQRAFVRDSVEVGRTDEVARGPGFERGVGARKLSPVIGESEDDVRPPRRFGSLGRYGDDKREGAYCEGESFDVHSHHPAAPIILTTR